MQEKSIKIEGPQTLEGMLSRGTGTRGVVIAHPHPLYGGNMDNPVVTTVARTFSSSGYSTLRFNFRGAGNSPGDFAEGKGEVDDLLAARNTLAHAGIKEITLAGYSFGAWIIVKAAATEKTENNPLLLVAPPAPLLPFSERVKLPNLTQIITGELDKIAALAAVKKLHKQWNADSRLTIINGCDHFFNGCLNKLAKAINLEQPSH